MGGTYHKFDLLKGNQILLIKLDGPPNDSPSAVPRRVLDVDGILVVEADRHIFNPFGPHACVPPMDGAPRDELETLFASRGIWAVIWNG